MAERGLVDYRRLLQDSKSRLENISIEKLKAAGIIKEREMKASSAINVTYPPFKVLPLVKTGEIFPDENNPKREITLYSNTPFCTGKCVYCGFKTYVNQNASIVSKYLEALKQEIELLFGKKELEDSVVKSLYIGGGTPTSLSIEQLEDLLEFLNNKFSLKNLEFSIESSPETLDKKKIDLLLQYNVNRLSMGVQSFDDEALKLINRRHDSEQAIKVFEMAKESGFKNINIDLIRGLPHYTPEKIYADLEIIKQIKPPSVTNYHLIVKPLSTLKLQYIQHPEILPGQEKTLLLHQMFLEGMKQLGYKQGPIDWFTLKEDYDYKQQRQKWSENIDMVGAGTDSYTYFNKWQYYNESDLGKYMEIVKRGKLPIARGYRLDQKEEEHRKMVFGLKYSVKNQIFNKQINTKIKKLSELGLIEVNGEIKLSQTGILFADEVCREFYSEKVKEHDKTGIPL